MLREYRASRLGVEADFKSVGYEGYRDSKKRHYEFCFDYYTVNQFKEIQDEVVKYNNGRITEDTIELSIIGEVSLKKRFNLKKHTELEDMDEDIDLLKTDILPVGKGSNYQQYESFFEVTELDESNKAFGYLRVDSSEGYQYIKLCNSGICLLLWLKRLGTAALGLGFLLLLGVLVYNYVDTHTMPWDARVKVEQVVNAEVETDSQDYSGPEIRVEEQQEVEEVEFSCAVDLLVYGTHKNVRLSNVDGNTVYLQYNVYAEDGTLLHKTGLIEPGKEVLWNAFESLEAGKHQVIFDILTYNCVENADGTYSVGEMCAPYIQVTPIECRK